MAALQARREEMTRLAGVYEVRKQNYFIEIYWCFWLLYSYSNFNGVYGV